MIEQNDKELELIKTLYRLKKENPDLPVVVMMNGTQLFDCQLGNFSSVEIERYFIENYFGYDEYCTEIELRQCDLYQKELEMTKEDFEKYVENYPKGAWKKVIAIKVDDYIDNVDIEQKLLDD